MWAWIISPWIALRAPFPRGRPAIRLATQIGSGLVGVLYVLDEPTVACISAITSVSSRH